MGSPGRRSVSWFDRGAVPRGRAESLLTARGIIEDIEAGLAEIDYPEVTREDRVTYLETAAEWLERWALSRGRTELIFPLRAFVARRRADLLEMRKS